MSFWGVSLVFGYFGNLGNDEVIKGWALIKWGLIDFSFELIFLGMCLFLVLRSLMVFLKI